MITAQNLRSLRSLGPGASRSVIERLWNTVQLGEGILNGID